MTSQISKPAKSKSLRDQSAGKMDSAALMALIDNALNEDISTGDITGESIVPSSARTVATLLLKEPAVIAGLGVFETVLRRCNDELRFETLVEEGEEFKQVPLCLARMEGNSAALLAAERTALNLIQRMCGIATITRRYAELAASAGIEILDTRKTTPGLRMLEKWAVKLGGGTNHRFGLYDQILIKDNHRVIAGGVTPAVQLARSKYPDKLIEVEVNTLDQLAEALALKVERVMLDNMNPQQVEEAVALSNGRTYIEVSGGINLQNIHEYLIKGVTGISIGALTHSAKNIDISLEFED